MEIESEGSELLYPQAEVAQAPFASTSEQKQIAVRIPHHLNSASDVSPAPTLRLDSDLRRTLAYVEG